MESSVFLYGNIPAFSLIGEKVDDRKMTVGFGLWIRCRGLWHGDCCQNRPQFKPFDTKGADLTAE